MPSRALLVVAETVTVDAAPHPDEPHPPTASTTDAGIPDEPLAVPAR